MKFIKRILEKIRGKPAAEEIALDRLEVTDKLLIRTEHSTYVFTLIDSEEKRGLLSGGQLGANTCDAVLLGTLNNRVKGGMANPFVLKTNYPAIFFIAAKHGIERLITSAVTKLVHVKGQGLLAH